VKRMLSQGRDFIFTGIVVGGEALLNVRVYSPLISTCWLDCPVTTADYQVDRRLRGNILNAQGSPHGSGRIALLLPHRLVPFRRPSSKTVHSAGAIPNT
jgi:hypothetical protein